MKKCVRSLSFLVLVLVAVLSAGIASAQTHAYITDQVNDAVVVYDASTYAFVTSVPVGPGDPERIAVSPNQAFAYATLRDLDKVAVIDTATNTLVTTVSVGDAPGGLAVTPNGAYVYVANTGSNSVSVISTAINTVTATVSLPVAPTWIAITPDGASAYVSLTSAGGVAVVATGTNTVTATITLTPFVIFGPPIPAYPHGLAVTPDGAFVYVATNFPQTGVHVISTATNTDVATIAGPYGTDLLVTPNGASVYVSDGDSTVSVIDTATNTQSATIVFPGAPGGIEVQPGGAFVWVGGYTNGTVPLIDTTTNTIATTIATGGQPLDVAFAVKQRSPQDQIAALIADINALVTGGTLAQNKAAALINKLNQVLAKLDGGQTTAACNQLSAFVNQVNAYVNSLTLTPAEGQALIDAVNAIKSDLGC